MQLKWETLKCEFENAPSFAIGLGILNNVSDLDIVTIDIAYGGMMYAFVDVASVGHKLGDNYKNGAELVSLGEKIITAVRKHSTTVNADYLSSLQLPI